MSFDKQARRQAQVVIDALGELAQAEIKALRAAVDARAAALQKVLSSADQAQLLDRVAQELVNAAKEETEARVGQVRAEVQKQAEAALAAARAEVDRTRQELEGRLADAQKLHAAQATATAEAQKTAAAAVAEAQKTATAARSERDAQSASFKEAQDRLRSVDQEHKKLLSARDEANKLVERETKRAEAVKLEVDGLRQDLKQREDKIRSLEEARKQHEADAKGKGRSDQESAAAPIELLDRIAAALSSINTATTAVDVFEVLNEHLSKHFDKTVVFQVGATGFKGWLGRGFGKTADLSKLAIPRHVDTLLKRASTDRKLVVVNRGDGEAPIGLSSSPIGGAVALPVITSDKVIAIAYAETAEGTTSATSNVGSKLAVILIDHISRRLTTKGKTPAPGAA